MDASTVAISLLNGVSYGLLLFMLSSGLTLIFGMMGVLNFAHASFYMLGAYLGYTVAHQFGFWWGLLLAPLLVGLVGAGFEKFCLRKVHKFGHVPELLVTFGLSYVLLELVQLVWGRGAMDFGPPPALQGPLFTLIDSSRDGLGAVLGRAAPALCKSAVAELTLRCTQFPAFRGLMMAVALLMLVSVWLVLMRTRVGLVIQAALTHPEAVETLGHNVPRVFMLVFGGGAALAGLAGVIGGSAFVTEPGMAAAVGSITFVVVVVGGMGSLSGAFLASLLIGVLQTFAVAIDTSLLSVFQALGVAITPRSPGYPLWKLPLSQVAPILPYLLLVLMLVLRPKGLLGTREG